MGSEHVTVAIFNNEVDAALARNYLETGGVRAFLQDEAAAAVDSPRTSPVGGIEIQVKPGDFGRAQFLLRQLPEDMRKNYRFGHAQESAFATSEMLHKLEANPHDETARDQAVDRLFRVAVMGLIFVPLQFYALWLLLTLHTEHGPISPRRRWKLLAAALLNVPLIALVTIPLLCLAGLL
jgi:hypothetical protein